MPTLFIGHGNPLNAIEDNRWARGFRALGATLPRPRAVLAVSAHWHVAGTAVTANERPRTIHDFGGFPDALYEVEYPAPGDPALARRLVDLLGSDRARLSDAWGLDHGTWAVLCHLMPAADIPVVQLSLDRRLSPEGHLELAQRLAPLAADGVLVLGSGNITHNLRHAFEAQARGVEATPEWAATFDADIAAALAAQDHGFLVRALEGDRGRLCHPTPEHYLPLLYAAGAAGDDSTPSFPIEGFDMSSLSMRAVRFDAA